MLRGETPILSTSYPLHASNLDVFLNYSDASHTVAVRSVYRRSQRYGRSFHWLEAGWEHPETIVLLHGFMAHSVAYRKIVPRLAKRYRLIIADLPAHGRDQTFRAEGLGPQIPELVDWLGALLDTVSESNTGVFSRRVHLVSHSLSALVAFMWAQRPGAMARVKTLTLVGPGVRIGVPSWTHHAFKRLPLSLARLGATPLGIRVYEPIQWRRSRMTSAEVASYVQPLKQAERLQFMMALGADLLREPNRLVGGDQVRHRTMILWGDRDHLIRRKTVRALKSTIHDAQVHVLRGIGHCPMEDSPEDFARLLHRFFIQ